MRNILTSALLGLAGCTLMQEQQVQQAIEAQNQRYAAGRADCQTKFPTSRASKNHADFARCLAAVENADPPIGADPDLVQLKQSHFIAITAKVDRGVISEDAARVQIAEVTSQIAAEGERRRNARRAIDAQERAAEAQRQAAFAQRLAAVAAATRLPPSSTTSIMCTTTGPYAMRSTTCF